MINTALFHDILGILRRGALLLAAGVLAHPISTVAETHVASPNGRLEITVWNEAGEIRYRIESDQQPLVRTSRIGYQFRSSAQDAAFTPAWKLAETAITSRMTDQEWTPVFGKTMNW